MLQFFKQLFPITFHKDVIIANINKVIKGEWVEYGEMLHFFGLWFLMSMQLRPQHCEYFSSALVNEFEGVPIQLNQYMRFEAILYPSWAPDPSAMNQDDPRIEECGNIHSRVIHTVSFLSDTLITSILKHVQQPTTIDYNKLKPYFGWVNADTIKKTFENSTQWAVTSSRFPMRPHFKSKFIAFNIPCRNEAVPTDTIFSVTPAIGSGVTTAQMSVGKDTLVSDVYPMQSSKQFVNTLEDNIRFRGAMSKLISDYAQVEISNKIQEILRMHCSSSWHSTGLEHLPTAGCSA